MSCDSIDSLEVPCGLLANIKRHNRESKNRHTTNCVSESSVGNLGSSRRPERRMNSLKRSHEILRFLQRLGIDLLLRVLSCMSWRKVRSSESSFFLLRGCKQSQSQVANNAAVQFNRIRGLVDIRCQVLDFIGEPCAHTELNVKRLKVCHVQSRCLPPVQSSNLERGFRRNVRVTITVTSHPRSKSNRGCIKGEPRLIRRKSALSK
mmetsp:Transcript_2405/g.5542  ORF Transcript_2405/g.5542 Transcript_2405/m.5542 type:complete len:206 (-) Transcript_2405:1161-1778(-)